MKTISIIGIGAGDPDQVTMEAVHALNRLDVIFMLEKGPAKQALVAFRKAVCERYIAGREVRLAEAESPARNLWPEDYGACVAALNREKQAVFEQLIVNELADGETAGILVWGDPSLYDSTIRNLEAIAARGREVIRYEVVPGISAVQALAAKHKIALNTIGGWVAITTGRRLREGLPEADSIVVMLDSAEEEAFNLYLDQDLEIYWGAYLGLDEEILISGPLKDVAAEISQIKAAARARHGWVFDIYLLRRQTEPTT